MCSWSCCFDLFWGALIFYRTILGAGPLLTLSVAAEAGHGCCMGLDPSPPTTTVPDRLRRRIGSAQNYCHKRPLCRAPQGQHILVGTPDRAFGNNEPMFSFIPHLKTAWLPWFTTAASSSPVKLSPGSQPTLASPFSKGLDTKWTSKCKGFSKKCSFHVRSKILPQSMTAPRPLLSILSVPQRERGCATAPSRSSNVTTAALSPSKNCWVTARTARYNAEPQRGLSVHHGSASLTLQILMIRSSQPSKCRWREEQSAEHQRTGYPRAHSGQVLGEDPCPHLQHNTMVPNIQQDVLLWKTATGLRGPGVSFIRPYVYFTAY